MLNNASRIDELFPEEVILFNESGHPYYVSPAASELIWDDPDDRSLFNEIIKIVEMVSTLKLKLSYVVPLRSSAVHSNIQCDVSKFGFGYKVLLKDDSVDMSLNADISATNVDAQHLYCV